MENEFISLGKCSEFLITMLGDFCSKNGMNAKIQKDYKEEKTKTTYGKYNFYDNTHELGHIIKLFYKKAFIEYKGFFPISELMFKFPVFLQKGITYFDPRVLERFSQKQIVIYLLANYIVYHLLKFPPNEQQKLFIFWQVQVTNTYKDILNDSKVNIKTLSENANWSSLEEVLIAANSEGVYKNEEEQHFDYFNLVLHYLLLGFRKALKVCFGFEDEEINTLEEYLFNKIEVLMQNFERNLKENFSYAEFLRLDESASDEIIYSTLNADNPFLIEMFYTEDEKIKMELELFSKHKNEFFKPGFKEECVRYFINSYSKVTEKKSNEYIKILESFEDEYYEKIIIPWYKARIAIFSLTFSDSKKDKQLKEQACNTFRTIFDEYKYCIGINLPEFLSDAIACDVYCNPKPIKDIINNSQDNTNESSIIKPGKSYWEFGYALGIFPEDSKKTYLLTYNAEDNFWTNFPPLKFANQKEAFKAYYKETMNSEFELPELLEKFNDANKVDNLGSKQRNDLRQSLGQRYYSNLSIRCMKAYGKKVFPKDKFDDFDFIHNYIEDEKITSDILYAADENGATPLIRSLYKYKMLSYGFTEKTLLERSKILKETYSAFQKQIEVILSDHADELFSVPSEKLAEYQEKITQNFVEEFANFINSSSKNLIENQNEEILKKLKEKVILPLIRKSNKKILDEAIILDYKKCVSALQLAIDSYDFEIVDEIINNLPPESNLAKILISNEYVTPLQYAIRKYDYLMQFSEMIFSKNHETTFLERREVHNKKIVDKGILQEDKNFSAESNYIYNTLKDFPKEECGLFLAHYSEEENVLSVQQKNLIKIIKLLADKTNPISVNTFYYIADQVDPEDNCLFKDTEDLLRYLIETNHAELTGSNFEWENFFTISETLLAYCINYSKKVENNDGFAQKNYGMLYLLLNEYPEKFRPIINQKVTAPGDNGIIRTDTDLHFFVTNQKTTLKFALQEKNEKLRNNRIEGVKFRLNTFLPLFKNAGADFDIEDQDGVTARQILNKMNQDLHLWDEGCPF